MREAIRIVGYDNNGRVGDIVYFAKRLDTGLIKIGTTRNIKGRIGALIMEIKAEVVCLGALLGGREKESDMHFKFLELSQGHEWFTPAPALLDFINQETMQIEFYRPTRAHPCEGKTQIGLPCGAPARPDSKYCFHHITKPAPA